MSLMNQQTSQARQHSPRNIQVANNPVKEVSKSLQTQGTKLSASDLIGLSWTLFEEKY